MPEFSAVPELSTADSWEDVFPVAELAYGGYEHSAEYHASAASIFEPKRSVVARTGGRTCGTCAVYSLEMTLPGGPRPVAGLGYVTVAPEHRRRGVMSAMVRRVLHTLHDSGAEAVAALNTTEAGIYGRFGFGLASQAVKVRIARHARDLRVDGGDRAVRIGGPEEHAAAIAAVYAQCVGERPGMLRRDAVWAARAVLDLPDHRGGSGRLLCMVAEDEGEPSGYALYRLTSAWVDSVPRYEVSVRELFARDPASGAALWHALLDVDLAGSVVADRPVDDPVLALLTDLRSAAPVLRDQLHVRLVDVDRALEQRGYATETDIVLDVTDPLCPWNERRFRLRTGAEGGECRPTTAPADLELTARELGSLHLGGTSLVQLARAGLVRELRPGAVRAAATAFRHDPAPFCPIVF
ncbi:GNAT family N-acetyltransferase [Kitasatospora sp. NPDC091335]|uniref:GNAT family N-acetyltransferase n=1 Tax=Kitasatospora sp. NPDC091335 TaxID=3364085 RepID=UPI0037FE27A9